MPAAVERERKEREFFNYSLIFHSLKYSAHFSAASFLQKIPYSVTLYASIA